MDERIVPVSEAKIRLHELLRELGERRVVLVRHGRPAAMIVDYESFEGLISRLEDLEDRLSVFEAREEPADMRVAWEKLKAEAGLHTD
jgi:antitoxin StbD